MSIETSPITDNTKLQTDEEIIPSNTISHKTDEKASSQELGTEMLDKTPISSNTTLKEIPKDENDKQSVFINEDFKSIEQSDGFNETDCVKFAEKLYKVFWFVVIVKNFIKS